MEHSQRWLPVDFTFRRRETSVRWLDFGSKLLSEPFFHQTIRALRSRRPPANERLTDLQELLNVAAQLRNITVSGIIFHVSRCGSTLLANALGSARGSTVLSEARPTGFLFQENALKALGFPVEECLSLRRQLLDATISLYGASPGIEDPRVIVKCHAASMLHIASVRSLWPTVPFLILIRDPVEVIVSNLSRPAGWVKARLRSMTGQTMFGLTANEAQKMSTEEYCARGLREFCASALGQLDTNSRVLDYEQVNEATIFKVADFFGIQLPAADSPEFKKIMLTYAKDPDRARPFENDRTRKQREATDSVRNHVSNWTQEPYEMLKSEAKW